MPAAIRPIALLALLLLIGGGVLRLWAHPLAWPASYSYSGPRESTVWAIREAAYQEVSMVMMLLGAALIVLVLVRCLWPPDA